MVQLDPVSEETRALWREALRILGELDGDWALVGGLMVQLHAARAGEPATRPTEDIDVLGNSRSRPSMTEQIASELQEMRFEITDVSFEPDTAFRFERDGLVVDVLAPEGTGSRNPPKTVGGFRTISIPGGSQALARTEVIRVGVDDVEADIHCPSLLGALLLKAKAMQKHDRDQDREDLVLLLACAEDPVALAEELRSSERKWLRDAGARLRIDDPDLSALFSADQLARARAAYRLLTA